MNTSNTIRRIRPDVEPLDAAWSAHTLQRITQTPATGRPRSRRGLKAIALTAATLVGTGSAAYAAGLVPAFITQEFDWISSSQVHDERRVASFEVPTGEGVRTFEVWRAVNDNGETCTVILEEQARFGPTFGGACAQDPAEAWFGWTTESGKASEPMPPATLYVYGEPDNAAVQQVRVHGTGFTHTTDIDPDTGGYAVAVPEITSDAWTERAGQVVATVDFLDENGLQVDSQTLRDR